MLPDENGGGGAGRVGSVEEWRPTRAERLERERGNGKQNMEAARKTK